MSNNEDYVVTGEGDSMSSALQNIQGKVSKRVYLSHNTLVVFSNRVVSSDFVSILDELYRNREMRLNQVLAIVNGDTSHIWNASKHSSSPLALEIREAIQQWAKCSNAFATEQFRFLRDFNGPFGLGRLVWLNPTDGKSVVGIGEVDHNGRIMWLPICSSADDGTLWVMGDTHNVLQRVSFLDPTMHDRGFACLHWTTTSTNFQWVCQNHGLTLRIKWRGIGYIESMTEGHESDQIVYRAIESAVAIAVEHDMMRAIEKMRESDIDGFEMRADLYRASPEISRRMEDMDPDWWKTCEVSFDVRPHIVHSSLATNSPKVSGD
ncbi:hypothetical protein Heshes_26490 [Alicyclobacillus hesperidum]|uniref:Uncharacterized protein n=2 Tax=Alicyclobacillus hesperidum TaxID=89784 RepID=A0AA37X757_9BACL|nr:hypothetical protein Heshes_26490 [Alicyclobacillus hesperidum]